eukprot:Nk52_evm6s1892 gene=Nk52_evmTU6s1892
MLNLERSTAEFTIERGVRQGDPISGLLFAIATLPLILGLEKCKGVKFRARGGKFRIKQSCYADDTAILSKNERDRQRAVSKIRSFCAISGMKLNEAKCVVIPYGDQYVENVEGRDGMLWLKDDQVTKYLGVFIGANQELADSRTLEDKLLEIDRLIERWRLKALSWKGKSTVFTFLLASKLWYWIIATGNSDDVIKKMKTRLKNFIDSSIVQGEALSLPAHHGGFEMINIETQVRKMKQKFVRVAYGADNKYGRWL